MKQLRLLTGFVLLGALMAGCNNASAVSDTRVVSGMVTALSADRSSLTVQGQSFALAQGTGVAVNGRSATPKALSVGQRVRVVAKGDRATGVDVSLELKGVVGAVDTTAMTLTVAGVTVKYTATTRFDLLGDADDDKSTTTSSAADLTVGTFVEVTGATDATTGLITATKVEAKSPNERGEDGLDDDNEIKGKVSGLSGTSFKIGMTTVNCTAPCTLPTGLKNGDFVEAEGVYNAATKTLTAKKVKLEDDGEGDDDHPNTPGASVTLEDDVHMLNTAAKTFKLEGYVVDYSSATVTGTLKNDADVKVVGVVDATNVRLVKASAVTVVKDSDDDHGGDDDGDDHGDDHGGGGHDDGGNHGGK